MKFTSDDGREWEEPLDNGVPANPTYKIIRPVKQEPKWRIDIDKDMGRVPEYIVNFSIDLRREDQAQLIKACIDDFMDVLFSKRILNSAMSEGLVDKFRQGMRENN